MFPELCVIGRKCLEMDAIVIPKTFQKTPDPYCFSSFSTSFLYANSAN